MWDAFRIVLDFGFLFLLILLCVILIRATIKEIRK